MIVGIAKGKGASDIASSTGYVSQNGDHSLKLGTAIRVHSTLIRSDPGMQSPGRPAHRAGTSIEKANPIRRPEQGQAKPNTARKGREGMDYEEMEQGREISGLITELAVLRSPRIPRLE